MWYCSLTRRVEGVDEKFCMSSAFYPQDLFDETAQKANNCCKLLDKIIKGCWGCDRMILEVI
jgi:hypothetical protein